VVSWTISTCFAVLPLALGAAILRYRLYDLDHIISRTLAYGLLTLLLAGGYAVVVLGLGQLLGQDSSLVVAAVDLPPGGGHRGYAAMVDGSGPMVACWCSHSIGGR
jgi:hypothetical protein